ncbi:glycosyltransferase family 2 protein [Roseibacillus persicicus]|uniref:Glycosyltransferase 2-like domain-containing protein n=1 Tax=Roseibacillus persicicus TaxID=454148 RepID=A0A918TIZ9_9BACT|nr:glycosyltransferase family 2 protein [Roseibacillus persicicus]GHC49930.1 hypothetical protein GCM10007100_14890 [Roseibacillus persicicus]
MKTVPDNNIHMLGSTEKKKPSLSFIVPAMNEEKTLATLFEGIKNQAEKVSSRWEVIFIDDGSSDTSWDVMLNLAYVHSENVSAFRFRHNRGKADALALGYREAKGDIVFTMDADLQDDPKEIPRFLEKLEEGYDIVSGYKKKRHDPWHKVLPSRVFNAVLSRLVDVHLHDHNCGFKAYRAEVLESIPMYGDMHRMVPSLASFNGYKTGEIVVEHHPRLHGVSKYGWGRIAIGVMDMTTVSFLKKFRDSPMHYAGKAAFLLMAVGVLQLFGAVVLMVLGKDSGVLMTTGSMSALTGFLTLNQGILMENSTHERMKSKRVLPITESHRHKTAFETVDEDDYSKSISNFQTA